jgi:hypothetical protein
MSFQNTIEGQARIDIPIAKERNKKEGVTRSMQVRQATY